MKKRRLPKSVRKYIRSNKAEIRRTFSNEEEIEQKIEELISKFIK